MTGSVVPGSALGEVRVLPCGPCAVLLEMEPSATLAVAAAVGAVAGVTQVVPAARTVLVEHVPGADVTLVVATANDALDGAGGGSVGPLVTLAVTYDGPDLDEIARAAGLTVDAVVALHSGVEYVVAFCGFAPGFAYLTGLPPALHLPRRSTPRTRVPAGSVAIAGPYSAVYPTASPGGWHLIGTTTATLWDVTADPPALLTPGTRVRFTT